jgi:hypothetical protein
MTAASHRAPLAPLTRLVVSSPLVTLPPLSVCLCLCLSAHRRLSLHPPGVSCPAGCHVASHHPNASCPPALAITPYDHPFYSNFEYFDQEEQSPKIQEHVPIEWDVGLGKHLQCCFIVPPPTHHALRLTCITPDATVA